MTRGNLFKIGGGVTLAVGVMLVFQSGGQAQRFRRNLPGQPAVAAMTSTQGNGNFGNNGNAGGFSFGGGTGGFSFGGGIGGIGGGIGGFGEASGLRGSALTAAWVSDMTNSVVT